MSIFYKLPLIKWNTSIVILVILFSLLLLTIGVFVGASVTLLFRTNAHGVRYAADARELASDIKQWKIDQTVNGSDVGDNLSTMNLLDAFAEKYYSNNDLKTVFHDFYIFKLNDNETGYLGIIEERSLYLIKDDGSLEYCRNIPNILRNYYRSNDTGIP